MTATQIHGKIQFVDTNGVPLSGGKVYTYEPGTTTDKASYTVPAATVGTENTQPVVLDSRGEADIYVIGDCKIKVTDSLDNLIYTLDNVGDLRYALAASSGSSLVGFLQAGTGAVARTVQAKERDIVSVKDFGAVGDGTTDDTAAIQAAIDAHTNVYLPAATYKIASTLTITTNYTRLVGAGMGLTTLSYTGSANAIEAKSAGGVAPTKYGISLEEFTVTSSTGQDGIYVYDVAWFKTKNVYSTGFTRWGINIEMCVSPRLYNSHFTDNARGARFGAALKNSLEYLTNEANSYGCIFNSNTQEGISLDRSVDCKFFGGDCSANANGILLLGARRNYINRMWIENNTTDAINTATSTSPSTINCEYNKFDVMCGGTGNVTINNGTGNTIDGYIAGDLVIANTSATPDTVIMPSLGLVGTLTDNGDATTDLRKSATYIKTSSAKRYQRSIGSTVDYTSDTQAYRHAMLKGLSTTAIQSNNMYGYVDITGAGVTSANVTFGTAEEDAAYGIMFGCWLVSGTYVAGSATPYMSARATTGFTINLGVSPGASSTIRVAWFLMR